MQIDFLVNQPQFLQPLAIWHHAMWGALNPQATLAGRIERLQQHIGTPAIPTTVVAFADDTVYGSASLVKNDLTTHPDLTPFLASVYVGEAFRRRGIASALVERVMMEARTLGVAKLYLITPDQQRLYGRLGWVEEQVVPYRGEDVTLMSVAFA